MRIYPKTPEECVGKIVRYGPDNDHYKMRVLSHFEEDRIQLQFLDTGNIYSTRFTPGYFWLEVPDYIARWMKRI